MNCITVMAPGRGKRSNYKAKSTRHGGGLSSSRRTAFDIVAFGAPRNKFEKKMKNLQKSFENSEFNHDRLHLEKSENILKSRVVSKTRKH